MSELSGSRVHGSHGGSSISIFSGVATSSASGTSDLGHINAEELSENSLQLLVEDASKGVRRLTLETHMFEGYYERLITGQLDFKWSPDEQMANKRSSMATIASDSTTESDSVRTSLADVSQAGGSRTSDRRRRSGSRTSHGSRGKTLRLTLEQKIGISNKEVERLEADLSHFRTNIKQSSQRGAAEIEERALKLREVVKAREIMLRDFEDCIEIEHGKRKFNFDKIYNVFQKEINDKKRLMAKLRDKNGVLKHQRDKLLRNVRQYTHHKEITGPVDIDQLQLENAQLVADLQDKNQELVDARNDIGEARRTRVRVQTKLRTEQKRDLELKKKIEATNKEIPIRLGRINDLANEIERQRVKNEKLQLTMKSFDVPTVDVYIELKLSLARIEKREDQLLRKQRLARLAEENEYANKVKLKKMMSRRLSNKLVRKPTKSSTVPGRLFHGKTFNIVYNPDLIEK